MHISSATIPPPISVSLLQLVDRVSGPGPHCMSCESSPSDMNCCSVLNLIGGCPSVTCPTCCRVNCALLGSTCPQSSKLPPDCHSLCNVMLTEGQQTCFAAKVRRDLSSLKRNARLSLAMWLIQFQWDQNDCLLTSLPFNTRA